MNLKKMIIAIVLYVLVAMAFNSCMAATHAGHSASTSKSSGSCH